MKRAASLLALILTVSIGLAEDEVLMLSPFMVSATRDEGYRAATSLPPITLTKAADYFVIQFELINDARLREERAAELHRTVLDFVMAVEAETYALQHAGDAVDRSNYQIDIAPFAGKPDTSFIRLILKVELGTGDEVSALTDGMVRFVRAQKMSGRTYVDVTSSGLSVKAPQSYRYEILQLIAEDIERVKAMYSGEIRLAIEGLDNRVVVRQASDRNVELFIPYAFEFINRDED